VALVGVDVTVVVRICWLAEHRIAWLVHIRMDAERDEIEEMIAECEKRDIGFSITAETVYYTHRVKPFISIL
jgi:hypothetical protein